MRFLARTKLALMAAIAAGFCAGCQQAEIIFHRHQPLAMAADSPTRSASTERESVVLAKYAEPGQPTAASEHQDATATAPQDRVNAAPGMMSGPAPQVAEAPTATQPSAPTATQPSGPADTQPAYTAPGLAIRYAPLSVGLASAAIGVPDTVGGGREAAESQVLSSTALLTGAPGLAAPSPTVQGTATSAPGIQRGLAASLGPASANNLFNRQLNPASGPNGRNAELIRAGFTRDRIPSGQRSSHR